MLRELRIENFGLIERAQIAFAPGATAFTGETGSGKTMLVGALLFALGGRTDTGMVRRGAEKATVTLRLDPDPALRRTLCEAGFETDPGEEVEFGRELGQTGRSSARINGRAASAGVLRELAGDVAEVVRQHEARRLLSAAYHRELLDAFAGSPARAAGEAVARAYERFETARREAAQRESGAQREQTGYDDARYALAEIDGVRPQPGELETTRARCRYLARAQDVMDALARAGRALSPDSSGAIEALGEARAAIAGIADLDPAFAEMATTAAALQSQANDLSAGVAAAAGSIETDPAELDALNARCDALERLERKYGDFAAIERIARQARATIERYEDRDRSGADLLAEMEAARTELQAAAARLTGIRRTAAGKLARAVARELADLALESATFEVVLHPLDAPGSQGGERVEFAFAANPGEPVGPLDRVASGGELSRVLLAAIVASRRNSGGAALVFDEVDSGIGGVTAAAVGARVGRLARHAQVLCVTHLAQLATWAQRHYALVKHERKGSTTIEVHDVSATPVRIEELARMLSGERHDAAIAHARRLLEAVTKSGES